MTIGAEITLDSRDARRKIRRILQEMDARKLLKLIGMRQLKWINDNFVRSGALQTPKWPPLSPNTVAGRRKGSSRPLMDTGRLRQSFVHRLVGSELVEVGTDMRYAEYHEHGTRPSVIRPRQAKALRFMTKDGVRYAKRVRHPGIPARPMLPTKAVATRLAMDVVDAAFKRVTRGAD